MGIIRIKVIFTNLKKILFDKGNRNFSRNRSYREDLFVFPRKTEQFRHLPRYVLFHDEASDWFSEFGNPINKCQQLITP